MVYGRQEYRKVRLCAPIIRRLVPDGRHSNWHPENSLALGYRCVGVATPLGEAVRAENCDGRGTWERQERREGWHREGEERPGATKMESEHLDEKKKMQQEKEQTKGDTYSRKQSVSRSHAILHFCHLQ